jgi:hypothetical protein
MVRVRTLLGLVLLLLLQPAQDAAAGGVRPALAGTVADAAQLTRICYFSTSGVLVCHPVSELSRTGVSHSDAATIQQYLAARAQREGLSQRADALIGCGDGAWVTVQLGTGATLAGRDVDTALNACLGKFRSALRVRMTDRLNPLVSGAGTGRFRWGTGPGTSCASGDPRRSAEVDMSSVAYWEQEARLSRKNAERAEETGDDPGGHDAYYWQERARVQEEFAKTLREQQQQQKAGAGATKRAGPEGQAEACGHAAAYLASLLTRCERTGWRGYECQKLQSCVNPALIFPTEDGGGLTCNGVFVISDGDRQVRSALQKACDERTRYGPDGGSPCRAFDPATSTRDLAAAVCRNPVAIVESGCLSGRPSSEPGPAPFTLVPPLQRDLQELINWGCRELGGTCVQLPSPAPVPPRRP